MHDTPGCHKLDGSDAGEFSHRTASAAIGNVKQAAPFDGALIQFLAGLAYILLINVPRRFLRWAWRKVLERRQKQVRDYND